MTTQEATDRSDLREALWLHRKNQPEDAPIHGVIEALEKEIKEFDEADILAIQEQRSYRKYGRLALWSMLLATVLGALVLLPASDRLTGLLRRTIESLQGLALTFSVLLTVWIALRQRVSRWMQARAKAEGIRSKVFALVIQAGVENKSLLAPALACFKDAHFARQLRYFKERGAEHRKAAGLTNGYRMLGYLLMVAPIGLAVAGFIVDFDKMGLSWPALTEWVRWVESIDRGRWQLGLGIMASNVLAFAGSRSFMDQDDRNASCYKLAEDVLEQMKKDNLPLAEQAALAGNDTVVLEFCDKVQDVLDAEHLAWSFQRPFRNVTAAPRPYVG